MSNLKYWLREKDMRQKSPLFYMFYSVLTASVEFSIFFSESTKVVLPCQAVPGHGSQSAVEAQAILRQYVISDACKSHGCINRPLRPIHVS